jgi:hypothetical protein
MGDSSGGPGVALFKLSLELVAGIAVSAFYFDIG